jgi:hypothetical protein
MRQVQCVDRLSPLEIDVVLGDANRSHLPNSPHVIQHRQMRCIGG